MRKAFGLFLICLLAAMPAMAASPATDKKAEAEWHSTACKKPATPPMAKVNSKTDGDDMNAVVQRYNDFATAAQNYMECVSGEAERDQNAIAESAQKEIDQMKYDVNKSMPFFRYPQNAQE